MRLTAIALGIAFSIAAVSGKPGSIAGKAMSGSGPLPGVLVQVFQAGEKTVVAKATTGDDGKYSIPNLPQTVYRVEFSRDGYEPIVRTGIVVLEDTVEEQNVQMTKKSGSDEPRNH